MEIETSARTAGMGPSSTGWLSARLRAVRGFSLPVSMLPVPLAAAAVLPASRWNWAILIISTLGAGMLHCAGNLLNDYFDFLRGVDRKLDGDENRPGRVIVKGIMSPRQVLAEGLACLLLAALATAYLVWATAPVLLWFALAAVVSLYSYTGPPLRLKYHALGEALIFVTFGPLLMLGAAFVQTGQVMWSVLLTAGPVGMATTAILVGNNFRDLDEDGSADIKTLALLLGGKFQRGLYLILVVGAAVITAGLAIAGLLPRVLVVCPVLLALLAGPIRSVIAGTRMPDIDARTAKFVTALLVAMLIALVVFGPA